MTARDLSWRIKYKNSAQNKDPKMGVHYDCKQHQVVCGKFWTVIISLISFPKF